MTGGLIQLVTTGIQDAPIIGNPEITFFKIVYRQHTQFSICQNNRFIGNLSFNKESSKTLEKNGDLLYNNYFKLKIPYFDIIKETVITNLISSKYDINDLSVNYCDLNCIILKLNNDWYIVPDNLFKLSSFENMIINIDSSLLEPNLLPDFITITNFNKNLYYYQINDSDKEIISLLRIKSNYWEQFWLELINNTTDINLLNSLQTLKSSYRNIYDIIKNRLYNLYYQYNIQSLNINDFNFVFNNKSEVERYFEYINNKVLNIDTFDIDICYNYCKNNNLIFNNYKNNVLQYNSLVILLLLNQIYSNNLFTFWKKYETGQNNTINNNVSINNYNSEIEWKNNLISNLNEIVKISNLNNIILDKFIKQYYNIENSILSLFANLNIVNKQEIYIKLKTIITRFLNIPNNQVNFNDYYLSSYQSDNFIYQYNFELNKYSSLIKVSQNLNTNEANNLTPVNLHHIFIIMAQEIIKENLNLSIDKSLTSFLILWKNIVTDRLYKNFINNKTNIYNNYQLFDNNNDRKLTFFYSLDPSNLFNLSDFRNSYYEMFYKNSFIANISVSHNNLIKLNENTINIFDNNSKSFNKLSITNYYYYLNNDDTIKQFKYINNKLYVRFDNYYSNNVSIKLIINNNITSYSNIKYEFINNELGFNSLYLVFTLENNIISEISQISLKTTYNEEIPILSFNNNSLINSTKYILYNKNTFNINNDLIYYNLQDNESIKLLTINYLDDYNIFRPDNLSFEIINQNNNNSNLLNYKYGVSYFTTNSESDISDIINISITNNQTIKLILPISNNGLVIGRKIYRTKANDTKLYLLKIINDNINTGFIDNINDNVLGIEYNIDNVIKYNELPNITSYVSKILVKIEKHDDKYCIMKDMNDTIINLPNEFNDIEEIYIEEFTFPYTIIKDFNINNNIIELIDDFTFIDNLYYLINPNNYKDYIKLICSKKKLYFNEIPFNLEITYNQTSELKTGLYQYKICFYNTITNEESFTSNIVSINVDDRTSNISLLDLPLIFDNSYNSWRIYRTKVNENIFFYLTDILFDVNNQTGNKFYVDNINDNNLYKNVSNILLYLTTKLRNNNYNLFIQPLNNFAPNLNSFISHSTNYKYENSKNMSDLNDFIFNKGFLLLDSNSSFYFYNINFKINSTSIIKLNDYDVNYLLPLSTQQFFIYEDSDKYYDINTIDYTKKEITINQVIQKTFNPSFDEFNLNVNFIKKNYYSDIMIDFMIEKFELIINNTDYLTICNTIENVNNIYINNLLNIFKDDQLFGYSSKYILDKIDLTYNNNDF